MKTKRLFAHTGAGGSTIKSLEAATGAKFAIQDSGAVLIFAPGGCAAAEAAVTATVGGNVQVAARRRDLS